MGKLITSLLLVTVIGGALIYSILYFSFNLTDLNNPINNLYRKRVLANHYLRRAFRLNQIGDARFDYATNKRFTQLRIAIYYDYQETLSSETIQKAVQEIKEVSKKSGEVKAEENLLTELMNTAVSDDDLKRLIKKYSPGWPFFGSKANLQIFVLKTYGPIPTYTGLVQDDQNIFLFMDAVRNVSDHQGSTQNAEVSTILHEFAHLLGANHVDDASCILSEKVENLIYGFPTIINTTYCPLDLEEIKTALSS